MLLGFGADIEVVSPPEVRADLASVAAAVTARYAGDYRRVLAVILGFAEAVRATRNVSGTVRT